MPKFPKFPRRLYDETEEVEQQVAGDTRINPTTCKPTSDGEDEPDDEEKTKYENENIEASLVLKEKAMTPKGKATTHKKISTTHKKISTTHVSPQTD